MQITSNTYTNYTQQSSTKATEEVKGASFASMLSDSSEEEVTIQKSEGKFVTFMDERGLFDSLSEENNTAFREILKDDEITISEMDSLSYEQVKLFEDSVLGIPASLSKEELNELPLMKLYIEQQEKLMMIVRDQIF